MYLPSPNNLFVHRNRFIHSFFFSLFQKLSVVLFTSSSEFYANFCFAVPTPSRHPSLARCVFPLGISHFRTSHPNNLSHLTAQRGWQKICIENYRLHFDVSIAHSCYEYVANGGGMYLDDACVSRNLCRDSEIERERGKKWYDALKNTKRHYVSKLNQKVEE